MTSSDSEIPTGDSERMLVDFFRSERPKQWPQSPWRQMDTPLAGRQPLRGKWLLVAAIAAAAAFLALVGETPESWPGSRDAFSKGKLEARRPKPATKATPLPGVGLPEAKKNQAEKR